MEGYTLLGIHNDVALWYFYSAVNPGGFYQNLTLKVKDGDEIKEIEYEGLWMSSAEAANFWFPETLVITATLVCDKMIRHGGAVAAPVIAMLKKQGIQVGLVRGNDGYIDVEPLLPNGQPKAKGSVLLHPL